jgi:hypothetical protein
MTKKAIEHNSQLIDKLTEEERLNQVVKLEKCSFTFNQEGNTNGTTDEFEELVVECESGLGIDNDEGCYYVLKTSTGWSIDSVKDLQCLFDRINKAIQFK